MKGNGLILNVILFFLFFVPFMTILIFGSSGQCDKEKEVRDKHFKGKVLEKYKDQNEHLHPVLKLSNTYSRIIIHIDKSNFYSFVELGDSLIKERGSLNIRLIRKELDTVFRIDYGCK